MKVYHEKTDSIVEFEYECHELDQPTNVECEHTGYVKSFTMFIQDSEGKFDKFILPSNVVKSLYDEIIRIEMTSIMKLSDNFPF